MAERWRTGAGRRALVAVAAAVGAAGWACAAGPPEREPERVLVGGTVWTGVPGAEDAGGIALSGGRIAAVGPEAEIRALVGPATEVVELEGRFAMPGFIDAHTHFLDGGFRLAAVDLRDAATPAEFARRLAAFAASRPEGEWILGGDWDHHLWGGVLPDRRWIDSVTPHHPVFVTRLDWHMALANTRALEAAGIEAGVRTPQGGEIVRDPSGRLTGIFKDDAMALVERAIPEPGPARRDEALRAAVRHALERGVTGVHAMGGWADLETYRRARDRGELDIRVYAFVPLSDWARLAGEVADGAVTDPAAPLRVGGLKGFVDGSLGSGTAWFEEPYEGEPSNRGLRVTDPDTLRTRVAAADSAGLQVAVHAIGDAANRWLLDLYESLRPRRAAAAGRPFRVEHAQHLRPEDLDRFGELDVVASMQPYHAIDDGRWAESRIGPRRIRTTYAFRSLLDRGAPIAFGSDWTVAPLDPLAGIHAAVTRRTLDGAHPAGWVPSEKIDVEEALRAWTAGSAAAGGAAAVVGTLEPGKRADLVVLDGDPRAVPPERIPSLRVWRTLVGGEIRYAAEQTAAAAAAPTGRPRG